MNWFTICLFSSPNKNVSYMTDGTSSVWFTPVSPEPGTLTKVGAQYMFAEWMNKVISKWYIHIMENYTTVNMNKLGKYYQHDKSLKPKCRVQKTSWSYVEVEDSKVAYFGKSSWPPLGKHPKLKILWSILIFQAESNRVSSLALSHRSMSSGMGQEWTMTNVPASFSFQPPWMCWE